MQHVTKVYTKQKHPEKCNFDKEVSKISTLFLDRDIIVQYCDYSSRTGIIQQDCILINSFTLPYKLNL